MTAGTGLETDYLFVQIFIFSMYQSIGLMSRVFANLGDQASIPGRVIPKT